MKQQLVKISQLKNNTGQIKGLPKNPRILKDDKFEKLKKSIHEDPEMLELREIIAYDNNGKLVVICGNMRLRAMQDLGIKEAPTKILPPETPIEKLKAYVIKDNVSFGEHNWDMLANEWEYEKFVEWGLDIPMLNDKDEQQEIEDLFSIELPFYKPSEDLPNVNDLARTNTTKELNEKIDSLKIDDELKSILKIRASFFTDFNFQKIADYYAQQTDEVKEVFEDLGMVILAPKEALKRGFIDLKNEITDECGSMF